MTFPLINYASQQLQTSPITDMIRNALSAYTGTTQAQFLRPSLEEQLHKAQLENQYYGPNIESQMASRAAAAEHARSLTAGQNITNRYLEPSLQAQLEAAKAAAQERQYFNDLLQRRLSGQPGQPGQPRPLGQPSNIQQQISQQLQQPAYTPGLGEAPMMQEVQPPSSSPSPFMQPSQAQQIQQAMQSQQPTPAPQFSQPPQLTDEDIINKHYFKIDSYTPKLQAYEQEQRAQQQLVFQDVQNYKKDIPVALNQLKDVNYMLEQAKKHKEWFGPGWLGYDIHGPSYRERSINTKEFGKWKNKLSKVISRGSQELSSKPLALALKTAIEMKPNLKDNPDVAIGNLEAIKESLLRGLQNSNEFVSQHTGQNLVDPNMIRQQLLKMEQENEPTVEVHFNGHILDVPESEISKYEGKPGVKIVNR